MCADFRYCLFLQPACQRENEPVTFDEKHRRLMLLRTKYFETAMVRRIKNSGLRVVRRTRSCRNVRGRIFLYLKALAANKTFVMMSVIGINNLR